MTPPEFAAFFDAASAGSGRRVVAQKAAIEEASIEAGAGTDMRENPLRALWEGRPRGRQRVARNPEQRSAPR